MRQGTPPIAALERSLAMLEAVLADCEGRSLGAIAEDLGVPRATAHRQVATLVRLDYLRRLPGGQFVAGYRLKALMQLADDRHALVAAAGPVLNRLAARLDCIAQLGTLDNDMVTYRFKAGKDAGNFFTQVGLQLEAYCTGIGKVLLAALPETEREAYLATGPFPALTAATITDPAHLRDQLRKVCEQGYARDDEEIVEGVKCVAVPIRLPDGDVVAAISASHLTRNAENQVADEIEQLRLAARQIEARLGGYLG